MIFKLYILLCGLGILIACNSDHQPSLTGSYKSRSYNIIQRAYFQIVSKTLFTQGEGLSLKGDSTFTFSTCGNVITGIWSASADTLNLFCKTNTHKNDSINKVRPPTCGTEPIKMYIDDHGGLTEEVDSNGPHSKGLQVITYLVKNK
ncbi:MAG: hypothetical protein V4658_14220 [Bacteroidota bacterium]